MNPSASRPSYSSNPIRSMESLSRALGTSIATLEKLAQVADNKYRLAKPIPKPDGGFRRPFDALPPLKNLHLRLKLQVFERVLFPDYLTGSVKGKDAVRNAALHAGAAIIVTEDIKNFFPSIGTNTVHSIWTGFFGFGPDVATLLTTLCTKDGSLPQGAIPSSYLANLAFWDREWKLFEQFRDEGISYSRYVDDVTVSSKALLEKPELTRCISRIYGLMNSKGLQPKRTKHEINRGHAPMVTTKLVVNKRPALPTRERQAIRAALHQIEVRFHATTDAAGFDKELNRVAGRVGRLTTLHRIEGLKLKQRISRLRQQIAAKSSGKLVGSPD